MSVRKYPGGCGAVVSTFWDLVNQGLLITGYELTFQRQFGVIEIEWIDFSGFC